MKPGQTDFSDDDTPTQLDPDVTRWDELDEEGAFDAPSICRRLLERGMTGEKYQVRGKVGQGGMAAVFKVFDEGLKRETVLKILGPDMMSNPQFLKRFIDEARITGQLEHPNIIPVHDIGVVDRKKLFFSMKYIEGEELGQVLRQMRRGDREMTAQYSLFRLLTVFRKICDAVAFAHSRGIIHRDIKPDNVMVGSYGDVMLVDWGLARPEQREDEEPSSEDDMLAARADTSALMTRDGMIKGTPAYMAPEQAGGRPEEVDKRTDIFLLGATLYSIATLQPPYSGENIYEILDNAENGNFVHPGLRAPERQIPEELCRIIMRAMAFDPDERYQTVDELCEDVDSFMAGRQVSVQKQFKPGEILMREGEQGEEAYLILSGEVAVLKTIRGQEVAVVRLREGDTVGEMAMISNAPRSATVKAVEDTEVVVITEELIRQGLDQLPPWMGKTVEALVERLRVATAQMHPLVTGDCTYHVLNQLRLLYPYWGQAAGKHEEIALPLEAAIDEIAAGLSVGRDRVARVISVLRERKLLRSVDDDSFTIPNYDLLCDFTEYVRVQAGAKAPLTRKLSSRLYTGPGTTACTRREEPDGEEPELHEVRPAEVEELLDVPAGGDIETAFDTVYGACQQAARNTSVGVQPPSG